jgi:hypothetical protein
VCRESWVAAHIGAPAKNRKLSCMSTRTHSKTSMVLHLSPQAKKTIDFCCFCERGSTPQKERNGESVCDFSCTLVLVRGCCFALKCLFQCRLVRWQRELFFFFFFFLSLRMACLSSCVGCWIPYILCSNSNFIHPHLGCALVKFRFSRPFSVCSFHLSFIAPCQRKNVFIALLSIFR